MNVNGYWKLLARNLRFLRKCSRYMNKSDLIRCALGRLIGSEKPIYVKINGYQLYVRPNTSDMVVAFTSYCLKEFEGLVCENPRWIIDAGANIGTSSIFFARKFPDAKIIAVEPEESNYNLLEANVRKYRNIIPVKAALWGTQVEKTVFDTNSGKWGFSVMDGFESASSTGQVVKCVTVKSLMDEYSINTIDLFKMDIEGGEKDVLENSSGWIDSVNIITAELHDHICEGCGIAFNSATQSFSRFSKNGEKITAYRV